MLKARVSNAMPAVSALCLLLSACGGGDGGNESASGQAGNTSLSAGVTIAPEPEAGPHAQSNGDADKPWYVIADPTTARFNAPSGVELDRAGNLYVVDAENYTIRKIARTGVVTTLAGLAGTSGSADGTGSEARLTLPKEIALDGEGNLYVTDANTIRKITPAGVVTTLAGAPGQSGYVNGSGAAARFLTPIGIAVDKESNVYVAECLNTRIRKITPAGEVSTLAGGYEGGGPLLRDGTGEEAAFDCPSAMTIDRHGRLFVSDIARRSGILTRGSSFIRRIDTRTAKVETLAGNYGVEVEAPPGSEAMAQFSGASGLAVDHDGNIFVTDYFNYYGRVQRIAPDGKISTVVTYPDKYRALGDVTWQWQGKLFVSDSWHVISEITPQLELRTYAGKLGEAGTTDAPDSPDTP